MIKPKLLKKFRPSCSVLTSSAEKLLLCLGRGRDGGGTDETAAAAGDAREHTASRTHGIGLKSLKTKSN